MAEKLDGENKERQNLVDNIIKDIKTRLGKIPEDQLIIFEISDSWPPGVAGLAAGRITEKYNRPSLVARQTEKGLTGSGRSIPGFDITDALRQCRRHAEPGELPDRFVQLHPVIRCRHDYRQPPFKRSQSRHLNTPSWRLRRVG